MSATRRGRKAYHAAHQGGSLVLAEGDLGSSGLLKVGDCDVDDLVASPLLGGEGSDLVGDTGDEDLALRSDELGEDGEEVGHGLCEGQRRFSMLPWDVSAISDSPWTMPPKTPEWRSAPGPETETWK